MSLQFMDVPYVYSITNYGFDFIYALSFCEDINIFGLKSIQAIINIHEAYWQTINLKFIGIPNMV